MNSQHNLIGEEIVIAWILALVMRIAINYLQAFSKEQIIIAPILRDFMDTSPAFNELTILFSQNLHSSLSHYEVVWLSLFFSHIM